MAERTEAPSAKRLREAADKGDRPRAPLVVASFGLLVLGPAIQPSLHKLVSFLQQSFAAPNPQWMDSPWPMALFLIELTIPSLVTLAAIAIVAGIALGQVGFATKRLSPDLSRLFPGISALFDKSKLWGALRGIILLSIGIFLVWPKLRSLATLPPGEVALNALPLLSKIPLILGAFGLALAAIDVLVGRQVWLGKLRMTKEEVTREHKENDGNPELKHRREELHHEAIQTHAVLAVRDASVLVVNPTHLACALRYERGDEDQAPELLGKGRGALALRMIQEAKFRGVPIVRDLPTARALFDLEVGAEIPEALFEVVAEILHAAWEGRDDISQPSPDLPT